MILAGVSLNAIVGDNGIITRAQEANILNSCAILQEFLQQEAVKYYDEIENYKTKLDLLKSKHPDWFYQNNQGYVMDADGNALYLIQKMGLPEEIQSQLVGGNASKASDFYDQNDVYGSTSDLQVYYCNSGIDTILGLTKDDLDKDNPFVEAYPADSKLAQLVNGGTSALSYQDLKMITELKLDESNKEIIKELGNLESLKTLTLSSITLLDQDGLKGIEDALKLQILNIIKCNIANYSLIGNCRSLVSLYLVNTDNTEVSKFTSKKVGIGGKSIPTLRFFGIYGENDSQKNVTDISGLVNLEAGTKAGITDLYLRYNNLTDLSAIQDFTGVKNFYLNNNSNLTTLSGIKNMSNLEYIYASRCNLGKDETATANEVTDSLVSLQIKNNLYYVDLSYNSSLKHIKYLSEANKKANGGYGEVTIKYLYLDGCVNLVDVNEISKVISSCGKNYSMPAVYSKNILDSDTTKLDLSSVKFTESEFRKLTNKKKLQFLSLNSITITNDDGSEKSTEKLNSLVNEVLHTCTGLRYVNLNNNSFLKSIEFVKEEKDSGGNITAGTPELIELLVLNTNVTTNTVDSDGEKNGLDLLNDNCKYFSTLQCNKVGTELKYIQKALNKNLNRNNYFSNVDDFLAPLGEFNKGCYWADAENNYAYYGLRTTVDIYKTVSECKDLKILRTVCITVNSRDDEYIDLTGCDSLLCIDTVFGFLKAKLPQSLKVFESSGNSGGYTCDFSKCVNLEYINMWCATSGTQSDFDNIVKALTNNTELEEIILDRFSITNLNGLSAWKNKINLKKINICDDASRAFGWRDNRCTTKLSSLTGIENLTNVEELKIGYNYCANGYLDISALSNLVNLKKLELPSNYIKDINPLSKLTKLNYLDLSGNSIEDITSLSNMNNLQELYLNNNKVSCLKSLENMKLLETLDVSNNIIYDYGYYVESNGETKAYNNCSVLARLNENGALNKLYLIDNFIDDFTVLKEKSWEDYSGW